jgi:hypothetical protein
MTRTRKRTIVYLDPALLRAVHVQAANTGQNDDDVIEDALRRYLRDLYDETRRQELRELMEELQTHPPLDDDEALGLAYTELHAARRARR